VSCVRSPNSAGLCAARCRLNNSTSLHLHISTLTFLFVMIGILRRAATKAWSAGPSHHAVTFVLLGRLDATISSNDGDCVEFCTPAGALVIMVYPCALYSAGVPDIAMLSISVSRRAESQLWKLLCRSKSLHVGFGWAGSACAVKAWNSRKSVFVSPMNKI
jgi:hypothetical protein